MATERVFDTLDPTPAWAGGERSYVVECARLDSVSHKLIAGGYIS